METTSNQCCHSTSAQVSTASGAPTEEPTEAHTGACCGGEAPETQHGYASNKEAHLKRLRRIEGQVRGIARMVDEDRYCIDVLTQLQAVRAALRRVETEILKDHLDHCVTGALVDGNEAERRAKAAELMAVLDRALT